MKNADKPAHCNRRTATGTYLSAARIPSRILPGTASECDARRTDARQTLRNIPSGGPLGIFRRFMVHRVISAVVCIGALLAVSFGPRVNRAVTTLAIPNISQHIPLPYNNSEQEARKRPISSPAEIVAQRVKRLPFQMDSEKVIPKRIHWATAATPPTCSTPENNIHSPRAPPSRRSHIT